MRVRYTFFIFFIFSFLLSCRESVISPDQLSYGDEYYPLEIGRFYIYNVDSIEYKNGLVNRSSNFQIKEVLVDTFTIGLLQQYRVERFKRSRKPLIDTLWPPQPDSVWTVYRHGNEIVKNESNIKYVKLVFPLEEKKKWNGNILNSYGKEEYQMKNIGKSYTVDTITYNNTLIVEQANDTSNIVRRDYRIEVFAKDVGMILKRHELYDYDQSNGNMIINSGIQYVEKLIAHGKK